jgi:hypothetical protein
MKCHHKTYGPQETFKIKAFAGAIETSPLNQSGCGGIYAKDNSPDRDGGTFIAGKSNVWWA